MDTADPMDTIDNDSTATEILVETVRAFTDSSPKADLKTTQMTSAKEVIPYQYQYSTKPYEDLIKGIFPAEPWTTDTTTVVKAFEHWWDNLISKQDRSKSSTFEDWVRVTFAAVIHFNGQLDTEDLWNQFMQLEPDALMQDHDTTYEENFGFNISEILGTPIPTPYNRTEIAWISHRSLTEVQDDMKKLKIFLQISKGVTADNLLQVFQHWVRGFDAIWENYDNVILHKHNDPNDGLLQKMEIWLNSYIYNDHLTVTQWFDNFPAVMNTYGIWYQLSYRVYQEHNASDKGGGNQ